MPADLTVRNINKGARSPAKRNCRSVLSMLCRLLCTITPIPINDVDSSNLSYFFWNNGGTLHQVAMAGTWPSAFVIDHEDPHFYLRYIAPCAAALAVCAFLCRCYLAKIGCEKYLAFLLTTTLFTRSLGRHAVHSFQVRSFWASARPA